MAYSPTLPDAIDLGQVTVATLADVLRMTQFAAQSQYTVVVFAAGGVLSARCIPTTPAITAALQLPAAGL